MEEPRSLVNSSSEEEEEAAATVVVTCCEAQVVEGSDGFEALCVVAICRDNVVSSALAVPTGGLFRWRREALHVPVRPSVREIRVEVRGISGVAVGSRTFDAVALLTSGRRYSEARLNFEGGCALIGIGVDHAHTLRIGDVVSPVAPNFPVKRLTVVDLALDRVLVRYSHLGADCQISLPYTAVFKLRHEALPSDEPSHSLLRSLVGKFFSARHDTTDDGVLALGSSSSRDEQRGTSSRHHQEQTSESVDGASQQPGLGVPVAALVS